MNTISPLSPISVLGSATSRQGNSQQPGQVTDVLGEIFKATVIEVKSNDQYLLDFGGNRLIASSPAQLSVGQHLQLQLTSTQPHLELKIVSNLFNALAGKSLVLLGNNIDISGLMRALQQSTPSSLSQLTSTSKEILSSFLPPEIATIISGSKGGEFLSRLFNRLGLNLENLLSRGQNEQASYTLKKALLEISHQFKSDADISAQSNKLLATLEIYQLAQLQLNQEKLSILPLPLPFLEQGYLIFERHQGKQNNSDGEISDKRFTLYLTLAGLGNVTVEFYQNRESLYIRIKLESQEKAEFAAQFSERLQQALSFTNPIVLTFSDSALDPSAEIVRRLIPEGKSILDTTI